MQATHHSGLCSIRGWCRTAHLVKWSTSSLSWEERQCTVLSEMIGCLSMPADRCVCLSVCAKGNQDFKTCASRAGSLHDSLSVPVYFCAFVCVCVSIVVSVYLTIALCLPLSMCTRCIVHALTVRAFRAWWSFQCQIRSASLYYTGKTAR